MSEWDEQAVKAQEQLDRTDLDIGDGFKCNLVLVGNGSDEYPLLTSVGVDRYGRLWAQYRDRVALIGVAMPIDRSEPDPVADLADEMKERH